MTANGLFQELLCKGIYAALHQAIAKDTARAERFIAVEKKDQSLFTL
jgi:hypothetical protein